MCNNMKSSVQNKSPAENMPTFRSVYSNRVADSEEAQVASRPSERGGGCSMRPGARRRVRQGRLQCEQNPTPSKPLTQSIRCTKLNGPCKRCKQAPRIICTSYVAFRVEFARSGGKLPNDAQTLATTYEFVKCNTTAVLCS